jgi:hypothetical protein
VNRKNCTNDSSFFNGWLLIDIGCNIQFKCIKYPPLIYHLVCQIKKNEYKTPQQIVKAPFDKSKNTFAFSWE